MKKDIWVFNKNGIGHIRPTPFYCQESSKQRSQERFDTSMNSLGYLRVGIKNTFNDPSICLK